MSLRHAAALALVGWYLMVPPLQQGSRLSPNLHAPLKDWSQEGAFDTAELCATGKQGLFEIAWGNYRLEAKKLREELGLPATAALSSLSIADLAQHPQYEDATARTMAMTMSECVATDDPRLKP